LQIVARVNAATDKALDYLEKVQVREEGPNDGSWVPGNNAINAMAVLAFLSRGHVPGRGKYSDTTTSRGVLTRAKNFLLSRSSTAKDRLGYLSIGGTMYEHGMATLALVELYGMAGDDPELESKTRAAVGLILRAQGPIGGWNYQPSAQDGDLSVSVMQIVAMRAAQNAGLPVPDLAIQKAIRYVRAKAGATGGYGYTGPGSGPQTSAAGALSMQLLGEPNDPNVARTLDLMASSYRADWKTGGGATYFYYFHYYAIQAFYQGGGKHWNEWHPKARDMLLENQNADGSWEVPAGMASEAAYNTNKVYATALATLVLNIYQHYLPAYQR
jgi:hypothetical protein